MKKISLAAFLFFTTVCMGQVQFGNQDLFITGQAAQTAVVNNIIPATAGATGTDISGYAFSLVQVVSTGTGGTFIFEGSNDPSANFQTIPVWNQATATGTPIAAAITATATQIGYYFPKTFRYIRLRIATAITGGSIQAISNFSKTSPFPNYLQVSNGTAGNFQSTVTGTLTGITNPILSNIPIPVSIADVASAAITTTTTTAAFTPAQGNYYQIYISVTVVSGTTPSMQVNVEESFDNGTTWQPVYSFPAITATGNYYSPRMMLRGTRIRYVQTITGTTPSFTRAMNRITSNAPLVSTNNNRQSWAVTFEGITGMFTTTETANASTNIAVDGVNLGAASVYTVPAGKRLRILSMNGMGFGAGFSTPNTNSIYDDGRWMIRQAVGTPTTASPCIAVVGWSYSISTPTGQSGLVTITNMNKNFADGEVEVLAGQTISWFSRSTNGTAGSYRVNGSIQGYLYDAY